jgi:hypothetical protein
MSSFVKKLMATGAALSIGISSFAVADYYVNNNNCCPAPACNPCANWCDNLSFNAAWLYWKASGDDFQYANDKFSRAGLGANSFVSEEKYHDLSFDLKSGFRVGVGFDLPRTCWGVNVDWTHFHTSAKGRTEVVGDTTPAGTYSAGFPVLDGFVVSSIADGDVVTFFAANKFKYDTVDIEFGKWLCCGDSALMFRPHAGFRVADIEERFRDAVGATGTTTFGEGAYTGAAWQHKNHFKGFGVRIGLDTDFHLCEGFSLVGRGAASAIWGTTKLRNDLLLTAGTTTPLRYEDQIREDNHNTRFITDLSLGVRYKTMACDCYPVVIELAWEHHYLFNQHRYWVADSYGDNTDATSSWKSTGDVALQGLTLSVGFDF